MFYLENEIFFLTIYGMKNAITLVFLFSTFFLSGQSWFQDGDQWVNSISRGFIFNDIGHEVVKVSTNDTMINGHIYDVLEKKFSFEVFGTDTIWQEGRTSLVRAEGDSIYYYDGMEEYLIYDFSMAPGDSIKWFADNGNPGCKSFFILDSIYTIDHNGEQVRVQEGYSDSHYSFLGPIRIVETIGVAEKKNIVGDTSWYFTGFLIPNLGLTCLEDQLPPRMCSFTGSKLDFGRTVESCSEIIPYRSNWFKINDKWTYNFFGSFGRGSFAREIQYERKDTMINEIKYKFLNNKIYAIDGDGDLFSYGEEDYIVRSDNRRVYYWSGEEERLVYDFNMNPGDSIEWLPQTFENQFETNCITHFLLDSIYIDVVDNRPIQVQLGILYSRYNGSEMKIQIYEGIGVVRYYDLNYNEWNAGGFLIPALHLECFFDGLGQGHFCRYESLDLNFSDGRDCFDLITEVKDLDSNIKSIKLVANPVTSTLFLEGDFDPMQRFSIYSLEGRKLANGVLGNGNIDINDLQAGTYLITVLLPNSVPTTLRFIKI